MKISLVPNSIHANDLEEHEHVYASEKSSKKYWIGNPLYFNSVNINALASIKIVILTFLYCVIILQSFTNNCSFLML